MMNKKSHATETIELEWHQLALRYSSWRIQSRAAVRRLMISIHEYGLFTPIIVVADDKALMPTWIVIDGYLRCAALRALNQDGVLATRWELPLPEALLSAYRQNTTRQWEPFEEAHFISFLIEEHGFSQAACGLALGRSPSWVSYRLQLLKDLPDFIFSAIRLGAISSWTASRVLVPFARANSEHSQQFVHYLSLNHHSSRDIQAFYAHYCRSNRKVRESIIENPALFFKARDFNNASKAQNDTLAPEIIWESSCAQIQLKLNQLQSLLPAVFYKTQETAQQTMLLQPFERLSNQFQQLTFQLRSHLHAQTTHETNGTTTLPSG